MKREELEALGLEKEKIDAIMKINGEDIEAQKKKVEAAELDRDNAQKALKETQDTLKSYEGVDVKELTGKIEELNKQIATTTEASQKEMDQLINKHAAEKYLGTYKFSSESAKKQALRDFLDAGLTRDKKTETFVGADDFMKKMKESDPAAFVAEDTPTPPGFTTGQTGKPDTGGMSFSFNGVREKPKE